MHHAYAHAPTHAHPSAGETVPLLVKLPEQHRFLVRDYLEQFDLFSNWEDDMMVTLGHIRHYIMTSELLETAAVAAATGAKLLPLQSAHPAATPWNRHAPSFVTCNMHDLRT